MKRTPSITTALLRRWLKPRAAEGHKGSFGHVLILAGSRGMTGAASLCAWGALRGGAGLVTLGVPASQQPVVASRGRTEMITLPLAETKNGSFHPDAAEAVQDFVRKRGVTSVAIGPGLSQGPGVAGFLEKVLTALELPAVVDADALNVLSVRWFDGIKAPLAITPHPGELARLLNISVSHIQADRQAAARRISEARGVICVLKGHRTLVTDGHQIFENHTGNSGMATGGTGDVLCGLIAALSGQVQGQTPQEKLWRAALTGVFVHGTAGDLAATQKTRLSLLAGDVAEFLPPAFKKIFGNRI